MRAAPAAKGWTLLVAAFAALVAIAAVAPGVASASCASPANEIERENCLAGTPASVWDVPGTDGSNIQGYATDISVDLGQRVSFKVNSSASDYRLDIYRMGYYGGDGARKVATVQPSVALPQAQPGCDTNSATGLVDCARWAVSAHWDVPATAVSGIYFAHLVAEAGASGESHVVFVVRDDDGRSDLLFQTADTTWQAYNEYGGNSFYTGSAGRAYKLSYNRPFDTRSHADEDWVFNAEYPMVRWLERNGYDVSYFTGVDSDRYGAEIREHRAFLSVGHDEYWSGGQRANVEAARAAGVSLGFFSGNEVFWKTRWEDNHRTLVSYKETHDDAKIDPAPGVWTGTWRDGRFGPHDGGRPENALTGQLFMVNDGATTSIQVPAAYGGLRFWRHTNVGSVGATLPFGTLGYEWDVDADNGHRPAGSFRLSSTTVANAPVLEDEGSSFGRATATHNLTLYRTSSGALVFGAGTVQWPWGLDSNHDRGSSPADARMQQATANLFADMGAHAGSLQTDLTRPSCSTDVEAPTSVISSTAGGIVRGTATDSGGGRVGGVEVSTDGGATWHPADGRETWSYTPSSGSNFRSRAVDDSGNLEGTGGASGSPGWCGASTGHGAPGGGSSGGGSTGGGSTGGASTSGSGTVSAPRALVTSRRVRASRKGMVQLSVACSSRGTACKTRLTLRRKGRVLAARRVVLSAGTRRVQLYLSRSTRRRLALERVLQVTAVASVPDGAGHRTVTRTSIRLLASRGRSR